MRISDWSSDVCSSDLKKRLRFPSGNYLHSGILATLTSSDWEIIGDGKTNTRLTQSAETDSFRDNVFSANLYRIVFRDLALFNRPATAIHASGLRVKLGRATGRDRVCKSV